MLAASGRLASFVYRITVKMLALSFCC